MKIGRNEPCPCGSGKKYKHCCLASPAPEPAEDLGWRRLRRLLDAHRVDTLRFVKNAYGPGALEEAWQAFTLWEREGEAFDPDTPHMQAFMPWFFHCWSPDAADTAVRDTSLHEVIPTQAYLARHGARVDPLLRAYLESCLAAPFSFFEVVRSDAGTGMRLRDVLAGAEHEVLERSASAAMRAGDVLFGQVAAAGGVALLEACSPFPFPPHSKLEVLRLRAHFGQGEVLSEAALRELDFEVLGLYHEIVDRLLNPTLPELRNTDGDPLSLHKLVFEVDSTQAAFDALKHLAAGDSDPELLADAKRDAAGALARVHIDWKKRGNRAHKGMPHTLLGSIEIAGTRLTAEVNSAKRAKRLHGLIEKALGGRARYLAAEIQSVEKLLAEAPRTSGGGESQALAELPEVKAKIAEIMERHYENWVDEKLPALGGRTPAEAAADRDGREAVQALVRQIERDGERMAPPLDPQIVRRLRERLGLTA